MLVRGVDGLVLSVWMLISCVEVRGTGKFAENVVHLCFEATSFAPHRILAPGDAIRLRRLPSCVAALIFVDFVCGVGV